MLHWRAAWRRSNAIWRGRWTRRMPSCSNGESAAERDAVAAAAHILRAGGIVVRWSSHPAATALVRTLGRPLTTPSANPAGRPPPVQVAQARDYFGALVDYYLDGGTLPGEPASTVVDLCGGFRVIRDGAIAA